MSKQRRSLVIINITWLWHDECHISVHCPPQVQQQPVTTTYNSFFDGQAYALKNGVYIADMFIGMTWIR